MDKSFKIAYDYIINVCETQQRFLPLDEIYAGYKSVIFKNRFKKEVFAGIYADMLIYLKNKKEERIKNLQGSKYCNGCDFLSFHGGGFMEESCRDCKEFGYLGVFCNSDMIDRPELCKDKYDKINKSI